ncbi:MAG: polynucleotide kinase-phosphatase, partial [Candidatus Competibacteraceae bacterium]|nr:polynucleotide kinase-phosphatase [Candidatus Competibacteraceae bacterium]
MDESHGLHQYGLRIWWKATALRYPEKEFIQVPAHKTYYQSIRPLHPVGADQPPLAERPYNDLLDIDDVSGKRAISMRYHHNVTIREENATAALEVMSRFAVDPHWIIYLPPTMAHSATCKEGEFLEHPQEAFEYFKHQGVPKVVCQEKHMGSRAVIVLCRDEETARRRFGVVGGEMGALYTRTGRPFFASDDQQAQIINRIRTAVDRAGLWERFQTNWICLDAEVMPWSAKAQELLRNQYASTGAAGSAALDATITALARASVNNTETADLLERYQHRQSCIDGFIDAYRRYCWKVDTLSDLKIAPFHLLATEKQVHVDKNHEWHMATLAELCAAEDELLQATAFRTVDVTDSDNEKNGIAWWEELTQQGGEGM